MSKSFLRQVYLLSGILLANFIAQIPYTVHLYGTRRLTTISLGSFLMWAVFLLFLAGLVFFLQKKEIGKMLLVLFLSLEFLFYLFNVIGSSLHGYPLFFQLANPDLLLRIVFAIGYLNLFASGYFLFLLFSNKR